MHRVHGTAVPTSQPLGDDVKALAEVPAHLFQLVRGRLLRALERGARGPPFPPFVHRRHYGVRGRYL